MKYFFLPMLLISFFVESDEGDIVETKIVDLKDYSEDKKSYCKERAAEEDLIWLQDFNDNNLSSDAWTYSTSNGFYDGRTYVPGWGNGELQYYTKGTLVGEWIVIISVPTQPPVNSPPAAREPGRELEAA